jgi:hypothetical protein
VPEHRGHLPCSRNEERDLPCADPRADDDAACMATASASSSGEMEYLKERESGWMDFRAWLAGHQGVGEGAEGAGDSGGSGGSGDASDGGRRESGLQYGETGVDVQSSAPPGAAASALMGPKDCRMESSLFSQLGKPGGQEVSVLLGASGIPASKCPVIPTKVIASVMTALYEPLVKLEVGVLTRAMESPMKLKPREKIGKGTLSLYILPDDSLSLTFEGPLHGVDVGQGSRDVMDLVNMNLGPTAVRGATVEEVQGTVWEELARFPRWREHSDATVVTVHMLKGDKSGRSFYVLAGEDAMPPQFSMSMESQKKIEDFRSMMTDKGPVDTMSQKGRRHYFWMMGPNLEESIHALGKMKSYIKRPPTLASVAGVPENILESVAEWVQRVDEVQRACTCCEIIGQVNPLNNLGAVLGRRMPQMTINQALNGDAAGQNVRTVDSDVSVIANASAVFKDSRFNISCPCYLSVSCSIRITIKVEPSVDPPQQTSPRELEERATAEGIEVEVLKAAAAAATAEGRCTSEMLARRAVEAIGKVRIEEWICEDFVHNTRKHRLRAKAERQRKRDLQRGYAALEAAKPMIQRAVSKLGRSDDIGMAVEDTSQLSLDINGMTGTDDDVGVVPQADRGKKISINDLSNLF